MTILRVGASQQYSDNYEKAFSGKKSAGKTGAQAKGKAKTASAKAAKKPTSAKASKKAAKKK